MVAHTYTSLESAEAAGIKLNGLQAGDITAALRAGRDDFLAAPTQLLFLCIIYPVFGFVLARAAAGGRAAAAGLAAALRLRAAGAAGGTRAL